MLNEDKVCMLWEENNIFRKTIEKHKDMKTYYFMEGPPFYTGDPHYGHISVGFIKDSILRYQHSLGHNVPRYAGADTHGLPIEYEIEKQLGIKTTSQILDYGIKNYNSKCKDIVMKCADTWESTFNRLGRWIDFKNDYKTMNKDYMNSVWWVFKQLYDKNRIYEGVKIMPYSTSCGTSLSNFETSQNQREIQDDSLYLKLQLSNKLYDKLVYLLVWTTTPWTLPSNYALCINKEIDYCLIDVSGSNYILAKSLISTLFKSKDFIILEEFKGDKLLGLEYIPPFYYNTYVEKYNIIHGNFVTESVGTGIVHIAPTHGQDDYNICLENNLIEKDSILFQCLSIPECKDLFYKYYEQSDILDLNTWVILKLKEKGLYYIKRQITHNIPFCWRSDTPLIYKAVSSWFIKVEDMQEKLVNLNSEINWIPNTIYNRFKNWLSTANDWAISRTRFWGTPIPIWKSKSGKVICVGSSYELEKLVGLKYESITDLHRDNIDSIEIIIDGEIYTRIDSIMDCWLESGSMPYATIAGIGIVELLEKQCKNKGSGLFNTVDNLPYIKTDNGTIHKILPADFIAEGVDQTRGWFYTLLVLSASLFNTIPFKNVISCGLILAEDGKKMSKRLSNYSNPLEIVNKYGADALRLYLLSSSIVRGENLKFSIESVHNINKDVIIPLQNSILFWKEYIILYNTIYDKSIFEEKIVEVKNPINCWILREYSIIKYNYNKYMKEYNLKDAINQLFNLVLKLSNGYIKIARNLMKNNNGKDECIESLLVLYCIFSNMIIDFRAIVPFFCEIQYNELEKINSKVELKNESVHLIDINSNIYDYSDEKASKFDMIFAIINYIMQIRGEECIPIKMPIKSVSIVVDDKKIFENNECLYFIYEECNILELKVFTLYESNLEITYKPNKVLFFKKYGKAIAKTFEDIDSGKEPIVFNCTLNGFVIDDTLFTKNIKFTTTDTIIKEFKYNNNIIILNIDKSINEDILNLYNYRLITSQIQKARKEAGVHTWDKITVYWEYDTCIFDSSTMSFNTSCCLLEDIEAINYIEKLIKIPLKKIDNYDNIIFTHKYLSYTFYLKK